MSVGHTLWAYLDKNPNSTKKDLTAALVRAGYSPNSLQLPWHVRRGEVVRVEDEPYRTHRYSAGVKPKGRRQEPNTKRLPLDQQAAKLYAKADEMSALAAALAEKALGMCKDADALRGAADMLASPELKQMQRDKP